MPDSVPTRRLYIGLMPHAAVRAQIVEHRKHWFWPPGSRLTRPERLHMTLHFLGDAVDAEREAALRGALAQVSVEPFALVLSEPEAWRDLAVLRAEPHPALRDLYVRVAKHCGIRPERRPYTPHVTLARDAPGAAPPEAMRPIRWTVEKIALVWSRLTPPVGYTVLGRYG
ncbi:MAG: RNA 2',3'-cyclic phosphodiesterase [Proteobacteria bacterium]|nr:RNA 2',3'-cyclic phosphodiesterase [Pseudomonadota bacterium]